MEATIPTVELSDIQPPEIISVDFSNYANPSSPKRDFIKIDVSTKNDVGSNGVITSLEIFSYMQKSYLS